MRERTENLQDNMNCDGATVVGIDVGGESKGFHAVALLDGVFVDKKTDRDPTVIVDWCLHHRARTVGVDAPCKWSRAGSSRLAERALAKQGIFCFATPPRDRAFNRSFYKWVFNGERLYCLLDAHYHLFDGNKTGERIFFETFPHAIACCLAGQVVPAKPKSTVRREVLRSRGYDPSSLSNTDFIDAALCAVAADEFRNGNYQTYGDLSEGFIVLPKE
jgi:predicted nuclease with RNAse H fold